MPKGQSVNILASLLRAKQFSQGFLKVRGAPQVSQMDQPVTLARTRLLPDEEAGFDRRVRVYGRAWARVQPVVVKLVQGKTSGVDVTHEVAMRFDPDYTIDARDMIFVGSEIHVVRQVKHATQSHPFVYVMTTHAGAMDDHDLTLVEPGEEEALVPIPEPEDDPTQATDFPVWS